MKSIFVPTSDVNSEQGTLVAWKVPDRSKVEPGMVLAEIETSKAIIEVPATGAGWLLQVVNPGTEISLKEPIGHLFANVIALDEHSDTLRQRPATGDAPDDVRATAKARKRAVELSVDLKKLVLDRLITEKDVEAAAATSRPAAALGPLPEPLRAEPGVERVLLIGGSRAATQIIDIFRGHPDPRTRQLAVGILDDNRALWGQEVAGVPVCGGTDRLAALFQGRAFDAAIVAISTSTAARARFRRLCAELGIPLTNAIDHTSKLATDVRIGRGNVICAFCHFGTATVIGDNNFISAYNSYDHHSELGNDISTGPGCMSSGRAKLRDQVRLGAGIVFEPGVELGEGVQVASGAILLRSVPARHAVKTKVITTTVVPLRQPGTGPGADTGTGPGPQGASPSRK